MLRVRLFCALVTKPFLFLSSLLVVLETTVIGVWCYNTGKFTTTGPFTLQLPLCSVLVERRRNACCMKTKMLLLLLKSASLIFSLTDVEV